MSAMPRRADTGGSRPSPWCRQPRLPTPFTDAAAPGAAAADTRSAGSAASPPKPPAADGHNGGRRLPGSAGGGREAKHDAAAAAGAPTRRSSPATDPDPVAAPTEPKKRGFLSAYFSTAARRCRRSRRESLASRGRRQPEGQPGRCGQPASAEAGAIERPPADARSRALSRPRSAEVKPLADPPRRSANSTRCPACARRRCSRSSANPGSTTTATSTCTRKRMADRSKWLTPAAWRGWRRTASSKQTENVDVACLKPSLVRVLKTVEQHYGKQDGGDVGLSQPGAQPPCPRRQELAAHVSARPPTSRCRASASGNWRPIVRTMPGRGGVGTYCHTESVHIDVGPERDWNWRCRRRQS